MVKAIRTRAVGRRIASIATARLQLAYTASCARTALLPTQQQRPTSTKVWLMATRHSLVPTVASRAEEVLRMFLVLLETAAWAGTGTRKADAAFSCRPRKPSEARVKECIMQSWPGVLLSRASSRAENLD